MFLIFKPKTFIMMIGMPGSGKSTFVHKNICLPSSCISTDSIRKELTGDATDQSQNKKVWDTAYSQIAANKFFDGICCLDSTMTKRSDRVKLIRHALDCGFEKVVGVFIDTPIDVSLERNRQRDRTVPEDVIEKMNKNLRENPPSLDEGFDRIITIQ